MQISVEHCTIPTTVVGNTGSSRIAFPMGDVTPLDVRHFGMVIRGIKATDTVVIMLDLATTKCVSCIAAASPTGTQFWRQY